MISALLSHYLFALVYGSGWLICLLTRGNPWRVARIATQLALLVALLCPLWIGLTSRDWPPALATMMGALVALLGWVIVDYASRYLQGDAGQQRFVRAMLFTLSAVAILVKSDNLLLMVLAWSATSFGLHPLLTHYQARRAAQVVAHKKFIVSRLADGCLLVALYLVYQVQGGFSLPVLQAQWAEMAALPPALLAAAMLFVLAAMLKTAQLPLHGWLIQVMEAPTPVSAFLHAGIVNMGGFVLISLAGLLGRAPLAQAVLVVAGSLTALLAGWVMMTRISIKVRLAWSTCAQMGFMLMEIGLGLYALALLHLVAHSAYKAYHFLAAGEVVQHAVRQDALPPMSSLSGVFLSVVLAAGLVSLTLFGWRLCWPTLALPWPVMLIMTLGCAPLLWRPAGAGRAGLLVGALQMVVLCSVYLLWHALFVQLAPAAQPVSPALLGWVCVVFVLLYLGQVAIRRYPYTAMVRWCYPWVYNGFYLDELFTCLTFKLWPVHLRPEPAQTPAYCHTVAPGGAL